MQVLAAVMDGVDRDAPCALDLVVLEQDLRVAEDAVERRAQFVRDAGHVARLGLIGGLGQLLGGLQRDVGALVGVDLAHQQVVVAIGLLLGHVAALAAQHHPPCADRRRQGQQREGFEQRSAQQIALARVQRALLLVDDAQDRREQRDQ